MTKPEIAKRIGEIAGRWKTSLARADDVARPNGATLWFSEGGAVRHVRLTRDDRPGGDPVQESINGMLDALGVAYRNHLLQRAADLEAEIDALRAALDTPST